MGEVMIPEADESSSQVHGNGYPAKLGANTFSTDFPLLPSNGSMGRNLNGVPQESSRMIETMAHPVEEASQEGASSSKGDGNGTHESSEHDGVESIEEEASSAKDDARKTAIDETDELPNGENGWNEAKGAAARSTSTHWTPADVTNSGWEIAEEQSVLGPGPTPTEVNKAADSRSTAAKELHTFYMIRIPKPADTKSRTEIKMAELLFKDKTDKRDFVNAGYKINKVNRQKALDKLRAARDKVRASMDAIRSKRDEIEPLQGALRKLKDAGRKARDQGRDLPASEQELDERIAYLEYRIQHESISLREEKLLLRDIKNLKGRREEVCANEALQAEFTESLGEREEIQDRLKPLLAELDSLKAGWILATEKVKLAEADFEKMDAALKEVESLWTAANQARQDAFEARRLLFNESNARNDEFYRNKSEIQQARQLAFKKDKKTVKEICNAQVERVMSLWNSNYEFRAAYVKSNERSTIKRLQTFDGRALGPEEEPPLLSSDHDVELRTDLGSTVIPASSQMEDHLVKVSPAEQTHLPLNSISGVQRKEDGRESTIAIEREGHSSSSKPTASLDGFSSTQDERVYKENSSAAAELKEKRRQQEMAKAKEADERKKRSAERSQFKALARAQKDAERREKEKEKKARKKATSLAQFIPGASLASEIGGVETVVEAGNKVHVQEPPPESKPGSRQKRKPFASKTKTSIKASVVNPFPKRDRIHRQIWVWIGAGLILFLAMLGLLLRLVL